MSPQIVSASPRALAQAAAVLSNGGLVAIPTETVYGLAANAFDARAVARIYEAKRRPFFDPLIVHIGSARDLGLVAASIPKVARRLIDELWPGPLTLVLPKAERLPSIVTSGLATVAVRFPSHPVALELIRRVEVPLAAPSANTFGRLSPTRAAHVADDLGDAVDLIVDGGSTKHGVESTIIDVSTDTPTILRHGAISAEVLRSLIGPVAERTHSTSQPEAPGQLSSHYAPRIPLHLVDGGAVVIGENDAYLAFSHHPEDGGWGLVEVLSPSGDLREAASRLFDVLHVLERSDVSAIYAELVPDEGIGRAINDRLRRAASGAPQE